MFLCDRVANKQTVHLVVSNLCHPSDITVVASAWPALSIRDLERVGRPARVHDAIHTRRVGRYTAATNALSSFGMLRNRCARINGFAILSTFKLHFTTSFMDHKTSEDNM